MSFFSRRKSSQAPKRTTAAPEKYAVMHPVLGEVTVSRSARARRLSIAVRPGGEVRLTIPRGVSEAQALRFLDEKQAWIVQARERVAQRVRERTPAAVIAPPYGTRHHTLQLFPGAVRAIRVTVKNGTIAVQYPAERSYEAPEVQEAIKRGIEEAWRIEAREYLPERTAELARIAGFKHGKVTIRNARTRWGSCSGANDISLSLHLMKLTDALIDYIILHELCHTVHKNHGTKFHALLDKVTGGKHPELRKLLKKYSTRW